MPPYKKKPRSSYTENNAHIFKRIFDNAIVSNADKIIQVPAGRDVANFRTKCSDALLWLVREHDFEHTDSEGRLHLAGSYAAYRGQMRISILDTGNLHLRFTFNRLNLQVRALDKEAIFKQTWVETISSYLNDPDKSGEPLSIDGLFLTPEEVNKAEQMFQEYTNLTGVSVVYDVEVSSITAIKKKGVVS